MGPIVFLDRDGVINRDSADYIKSPEEFHFIAESPEAIALLCDHGFEVILITNQSAVGRKMISADTLERIFDKLKKGVAAAGGKITDIFYCPHIPDAGCACRKPATGLIDRALAKYGVDPVTTAMVGDSAKDILCGKAAGCGRTVLVATGNGPEAKTALALEGRAPDFYAADLMAAARWLIANS